MSPDGDDQSAHTCLNRLSLRRDPLTKGIMGLRGLYEEATAKDQSALERCLQEYDNTLAQSPVNVVSIGCAPSVIIGYARLTIHAAHPKAPGSVVTLAQPTI